MVIKNHSWASVAYVLPILERGGKLLITSINQFLDSENYKGLLFCKEGLISFYSKYNWKLIPPERVHFRTPHEGVFTMVFNCEDIERLDYDDRFF